MGKRSKPVVQKDAFKRINFLYQAACVALSSNPKNTGLARFYIECLNSISHKQILKLDPNIKRTICKCCHSLLVPGITCKVRSRAKRESHMVVSCLYCKKVKRFLARDDYVLWKNTSQPPIPENKKQHQRHDRKHSEIQSVEKPNQTG